MSVRILVIEDNLPNLELMMYLLRAFGYAAQCAMDGAAGLSTAQRDLPDLIICDVQLPSLEGLEVARRIKAIPEVQTIPLIAITALAMVDDCDRVLTAGFDGYITLPIDPETFGQQVEAFLLRGQGPTAQIAGCSRFH